MGYVIAMALKWAFCLAFLCLPYIIACLVWKYMPDSWIKTCLFRSFGKDSGPWMESLSPKAAPLVEIVGQPDRSP